MNRVILSLLFSLFAIFTFSQQNDYASNPSQFIIDSLMASVDADSLLHMDTTQQVGIISTGIMDCTAALNFMDHIPEALQTLSSDSIKANYEYVIFNFKELIIDWPSPPAWYLGGYSRIGDISVGMPIGMYALVFYPKTREAAEEQFYIHFFKVIDQTPPIFGLDKGYFNKYFYDEDTLNKDFAFERIPLASLQRSAWDNCRDFKSDSILIRRNVQDEQAKNWYLSNGYDLNQDGQLDSIDFFTLEEGQLWSPWEKHLDVFKTDFVDTATFQVFIEDEVTVWRSFFNMNYMTFGVPNDSVYTFQYRLVHGGGLIPGLITFGDGSPIHNMGVRISGSGKYFSSNGQGEFQIPQVDISNNSEIIPPSNLSTPWNYLVTTIDLITIQKHLLGIELLDNPYDLLAADVNNTGSITIGDLIQIQKLILGKSDGFTNTTAWYFLDANFEFNNPQAPWNETWPKRIPINTESGQEPAFHLIGVKLGDVKR